MVSGWRGAEFFQLQLQWTVQKVSSFAASELHTSAAVHPSPKPETTKAFTPHVRKSWSSSAFGGQQSQVTSPGSPGFIPRHSPFLLWRHIHMDFGLFPGFSGWCDWKLHLVDTATPLLKKTRREDRKHNWWKSSGHLAAAQPWPVFWVHEHRQAESCLGTGHQCKTAQGKFWGSCARTGMLQILLQQPGTEWFNFPSQTRKCPQMTLQSLCWWPQASFCCNLLSAWHDPSAAWLLRIKAEG